MGKGVIIFDFDGVLADSFEALYKINALAFRAQGKKLTKTQYRNFFINDFNEGVKKFCGDEKKYEKLTNFRKKIKEKYYNDVKLFPHTKPLIRRLKKQKNSLGIISVTSEDLVKMLLNKSGLDNYFDFILSSAGASKAEILKQVILSNGYKISESYFVTDTFNDICYGKKAGLQTIAVLWGFNAKELLLKGKPDFILKNCEEIFSIINNHY